MNAHTGSDLPHWLQRLEYWGNRIPHPALLFVGLCLFLLPLTALVSWMGVEVTHPTSGHEVAVKSLLAREGIFYISASLVNNFIQFAPLGVVLVAMLGIGIAEKSGLLDALLQGLVARAPRTLLIPLVALAGVLSSVAADAGYVVLIPLAALLFRQAGFAPALGLAVAFAAVSGGFGANLVLGPFDAILSGISTEALRIIEPETVVPVTGNYWFMAASSLLVIFIVTLVARFCFSNLMNTSQVAPTPVPVSATSLRKAAWAVLLYAAVIALWALYYLPEGKTAQSLLQQVVVIIALGFAVAGIAFGFAEKTFTRGEHVIKAMEDTMATLAGYIVLMFFVAQFVSWFQWSNLALAFAIYGADWLAHMAMPNTGLLVLFIGITTLVNLMIGSASAKWALLAPIFIPMFALLGVDANTVQAAYRVGDSATTIITPLMPYFALVLGFLRQHQPQAGIGTLIAMMLPFSLALLVGWTVFFLLWYSLGLPFGF